LSRIAQAKGILGLITDGAVRDSDSIRALGFPVFCRGTGLFGPTKQHPGTLGEPIVLDGVRIAPGDWVLADGDGVVVIAGEEVEQTIAAAQAVAERERQMVRRAELGESTLDQLGLADKH
jgi:4-hydroxy-4-methyl-2-oxoglutarate aldolase